MHIIYIYGVFCSAIHYIMLIFLHSVESEFYILEPHDYYEIQSID